MVIMFLSVSKKTNYYGNFPFYSYYLLIIQIASNLFFFFFRFPRLYDFLFCIDRPCFTIAHTFKGISRSAYLIFQPLFYNIYVFSQIKTNYDYYKICNKKKHLKYFIFQVFFVSSNDLTCIFMLQVRIWQ